MERGYIKLWRKMLDSKSASRGANYIAMMVYLLLRANWQSCFFNGQEIQRGEVAISLSSLSEALGISMQTTRTVLKNLQNDNFLVLKSTKRFTSITICKYADYQVLENSDQQTTNKELTNDQQTTNKQLTKNKELQELQENNNTLTAPACACEGDAEKILGPELAEDFKRFLYVWKDTHGKGKEMNIFQQEAQLRTLIGIPKEQRKEAIQRAIRGGWKALHNLDELGNTPAPGAQPVRAAKKRFDPADPTTWPTE